MNKPDDFWDCHCLFNVKNQKVQKKLVPGIEQLAEAVDLAAYLPTELHNILEALFRYRNKMFHNGFKWPLKECAEFAKRVKAENWFSFAERGGDPFIVYMTETFINHCFDLVHKLLDAFGAYCKAHESVDMIPIQMFPSTE